MFAKYTLELPHRQVRLVRQHVHPLLAPSSSHPVDGARSNRMRFSNGGQTDQSVAQARKAPIVRSRKNGRFNFARSRTEDVIKTRDTLTDDPGRYTKKRLNAGWEERGSYNVPATRAANDKAPQGRPDDEAAMRRPDDPGHPLTMGRIAGVNNDVDAAVGKDTHTLISNRRNSHLPQAGDQVRQSRR